MLETDDDAPRDQEFETDENQELESEEDVKEYDPDDHGEFQRRMETNNILPGSDVWRLLWKEKAETRARRMAEDHGRDEESGEAEGQGAADAQGREGAGGGGGEDSRWHPKLRLGDDFFDLDDRLEEARQLKVCPPCPKPAADEVRKHKASGHSPYRSWCPICLLGAASDRPHHVSLRA